MNIIKRKVYGESGEHRTAKNIVTDILAEMGATFKTPYCEAPFIIEPNDITHIIQEYQWMKRRRGLKPMQTFSADIAVFKGVSEHPYFVIEIFKCSGVSKKKIRFYRDLCIPYIELGASYVNKCVDNVFESVRGNVADKITMIRAAEHLKWIEARRRSMNCYYSPDNPSRRYRR